ncbi:RNA polymerase sigma-70 factor (ECF subfamily) [Actinoplanes campanulatus]|uniref:RNA polymerase sigma-70 factor (ECF subfamily) n=1 Tax=Actinoplanes campanulatus TaxID=113559 RepID=A0A7W5FKE4_9ACTN|nr:sigma-70 family RNA polymerase sigma factor [Actinoplanes campanulatus]MBB3101621.1 RNA polymerase sigma-70 factor (ECF subfamily) [Actinoplanes campanulatus]GGN51689.1 hypothetical protein GCM10010109_92030 [Actinoplanes campanulatus]GID42679.1 hypothetical protein Aca09nite_91850 [Actinoplanes campanulatus]
MPTTSEDPADDAVPDSAAPQSGYEDFFRENKNRVFDHGRRIANSPQQGEDAAQEALIKAHECWQRVSVMEDPTGWVMRVTENKLFHMRRNGQRLPTVPLTIDQQVVSDHSAEVAASLDFEEAIARLPPQQRRIIDLSWKSDMGAAAIAARLNIKESTVRSNLARARAQLEALRTDDAR